MRQTERPWAVRTRRLLMAQMAVSLPRPTIEIENEGKLSRPGEGERIRCKPQLAPEGLVLRHAFASFREVHRRYCAGTMPTILQKSYVSRIAQPLPYGSIHSRPGGQVGTFGDEFGCII